MSLRRYRLIPIQFGRSSTTPPLPIAPALQTTLERGRAILHTPEAQYKWGYLLEKIGVLRQESCEFGADLKRSVHRTHHDLHHAPH